MLNYNFQLGTEGPHCGLSFSPSVTDWQAGEGCRHPPSFPPSLRLFLWSSRLLYCVYCSSPGSGCRGILSSWLFDASAIFSRNGLLALNFHGKEIPHFVVDSTESIAGCVLIPFLPPFNELFLTHTQTHTGRNVCGRCEFDKWYWQLLTSFTGNLRLNPCPSSVRIPCPSVCLSGFFALSLLFGWVLFIYFFTSRATICPC